MDGISGLKDDLPTPIATTLVPGLIGAVPWVVLCGVEYPWAVKPILDSATIFSLLTLIVSIGFGMTFEAIGSWIEIQLWRCPLKKFGAAQRRDIEKEWDEYVRLHTKDEIVGQRYLRTIVPKLKFMLSMIPATLSVVFGTWWLKYRFQKPSDSATFGVFVIGILFAIGCSCGAYDLMKQLLNLRKEIVDSHNKHTKRDVAPSETLITIRIAKDSGNESVVFPD